MFEYELETQLVMISEFVQYILIIEMIITSVSCIDLSAPTNEIVIVMLFLIQLMFGVLLSDNIKTNCFKLITLVIIDDLFSNHKEIVLENVLLTSE